MDDTILYELRESVDKCYSVEEFLDVASDLIAVGSFDQRTKDGFADFCIDILSSPHLYTVYEVLGEVERYLGYEYNDM